MADRGVDDPGEDLVAAEPVVRELEHPQHPAAERMVQRRADPAAEEGDAGLVEVLVDEAGIGIGGPVQHGDAMPRHAAAQSRHHLADRRPDLVVGIGGVQHPSRLRGGAGAGGGVDPADVVAIGEGVEQRLLVGIKVVEQERHDRPVDGRGVLTGRAQQIGLVVVRRRGAGRQVPMQTHRLLGNADSHDGLLRIRNGAQRAVRLGHGADRPDLPRDRGEQALVLDEHVPHRPRQRHRGQWPASLGDQVRRGQRLRQPTQRQDLHSGDPGPAIPTRQSAPRCDPNVLGRDENRDQPQRVVRLQLADHADQHAVSRGAELGRAIGHVIPPTTQARTRAPRRSGRVVSSAGSSSSGVTS